MAPEANPTRRPRPRVTARRIYCIQSTVLTMVGLMSTCALVLLVFGSCSLASRPHDPSSITVGTLLGGGLLMLFCLCILMAMCVWTGRLWPLSPPVPSGQGNQEVGSPPVILLDAVSSPFPPSPKPPKEVRYLSPGVYRGLGVSSGGLYAPLAQEEELTPSLRSSFQSAEDIS